MNDEFLVTNDKWRSGLSVESKRGWGGAMWGLAPSP